MSEKFISNKSETDWVSLNAMTDEDIDFSDCPEVTSEQFANVVVRHGVAKRRHKDKKETRSPQLDGRFVIL